MAVSLLLVVLGCRGSSADQSLLVPATSTPDSLCVALAEARVADPGRLLADQGRVPTEAVDRYREALTVLATSPRLSSRQSDALSGQVDWLVDDPSSWSDPTWAEFLVGRASPDALAAVETIEATC